jgi:hypothetical protein
LSLAVTAAMLPLPQFSDATLSHPRHPEIKLNIGSLIKDFWASPILLHGQSMTNCACNKTNYKT